MRTNDRVSELPFEEQVHDRQHERSENQRVPKYGHHPIPLSEQYWLYIRHSLNSHRSWLSRTRLCRLAKRRRAGMRLPAVDGRQTHTAPCRGDVWRPACWCSGGTITEDASSSIAAYHIRATSQQHVHAYNHGHTRDICPPKVNRVECTSNTGRSEKRAAAPYGAHENLSK